MTRIYVAASWRNPHQEQVVGTLGAMGHDVYDFKHPYEGNDGFSWQGVSMSEAPTAFEQRKILLENAICAQGFMNDFRAMQWAEVGVLLLPSGRSAHLELGWMAGRGKRTIIVMQNGEVPELMQLLADELVVGLPELYQKLVDI